MFPFRIQNSSRQDETSNAASPFSPLRCDSLSVDAWLSYVKCIMHNRSTARSQCCPFEVCETSKRKKMDCIVEVPLMGSGIKVAGSWNEKLDDQAGLHSERWGEVETGGTRTSFLTIAANAASLEAVIG